MFETIKKRSKKLHFSKLIVKYKDNIKKTWFVIKEVIGKEKPQQQNFPQKICVGNKGIIDLKTIAEKFSKLVSMLLSGICRDKLKISSVTPLFKKESHSELGNYRPISLLPCFFLNS